MLKKIIKFIIIIVPWFISGFLIKDFSYYNNINLPSFAIPNYLFSIIWFILYILISINIYFITDKNKFNDIKSYFKILTINYIFNQLFVIIFFLFENTFLGFVDTVIVLLSSLFLYYESKEIDKYASKFLIPYVYFNLYASILSLIIYFINL